MHNPKVSEQMRIGFGILAASWFSPVLAWAFLALLSEVRREGLSETLWELSCGRRNELVEGF